MRKLFIALLLTVPFMKGAQAENVYPTDEVVRYVIGCMGELGEQSEQNLYTCVCRIDHLRANLTYEEYDGGNIMERYKRMPGKKGGFFRDNEHGDELFEKLVKTRESAFQQCPKVISIKVEVKEAEPQ